MFHGLSLEIVIIHADQADLARIPLERLVNVPVAMVRASGRTAVSAVAVSDD